MVSYARLGERAPTWNVSENEKIPPREWKKDIVGKVCCCWQDLRYRNEFNQALTEDNKDVMWNLIMVKGYDFVLYDEETRFLVKNKRFQMAELFVSQYKHCSFEWACCKENVDIKTRAKFLDIYYKYYPFKVNYDGDKSPFDWLEKAFDNKSQEIVQTFFKRNPLNHEIIKYIKELRIFKSSTLSDLKTLLDYGLSSRQIAIITGEIPLLKYLPKVESDEDLQIIERLLDENLHQVELYKFLEQAIDLGKDKVVSLTLNKAKVDLHKGQIAWEKFIKDDGNYDYNEWISCGSLFQRALVRNNIKILEIFRSHLDATYHSLIDNHVKNVAGRVEFREQMKPVG